MNAYNWAIDIHDAVVLCCEATDYAKDVYCSGTTPDEPSLNYIHRNRNKILSEYFSSIGIKSNSMKDWKEDVVSRVEEYKGIFNCNRIVLK